MEKTAFNKKETLFASKSDLNFRKKLVMCYVLSTVFKVMKIGLFRKVNQKYLKRLGENGEDQLDRQCQEWRSVTKSQETNILRIMKIRKANWIGHMVHRNWFLKHVTGKSVEYEFVRRGKRRKDLTNNRGPCKLTEEALDPIMWRTRSGTGYGRLVRQRREWW